MEQSRERIIVLENDAAVRDGLIESLRRAGYDAVTFATLAEGLEAARQSGADLLLLDAGACSPDSREVIASVRGSAATAGLRLILLVGAAAADRAAALDIGADDAISRPWDSEELVSRVRAQVRIRRAENDLREKARIAEEGQQIAHTAFEALAVTEKMASDATSLDRRLKIGVTAAFGARR